MNIINIMAPLQLAMPECEGNTLVILSSWFPINHSDRIGYYTTPWQGYKTKMKIPQLDRYYKSFININTLWLLT